MFTVSPHLGIATKSQVYAENYLCQVCSRLWSTGVPRNPKANAAQRVARFFSNTCQKMWGGKHVKVKKRQHQEGYFVSVFALMREC